MINKNTELRCCSGHLILARSVCDLRFESSVISYGSETRWRLRPGHAQFESSVISYGSETAYCDILTMRRFESSVISYGSETACFWNGGGDWV